MHGRVRRSTIAALMVSGHDGGMDAGFLEGARRPNEGPQRVALHNWLAFAEETESIVHLTHEGLNRVKREPEFLEIMNRYAEEGHHVYGPEELEDARKKALWAECEANAGFPLVHAHALLGLWGGLERLVEDLFLGGIEDNPSHLEGKAFAKVKIPVALAAAPHGHIFRSAILLEAQRAVAGGGENGVGQFENLLDLVDLGGGVPSRIRESLFQANQIRNVWAHRGGVADARFVETCAGLGFGLGERVDMGPELFFKLVRGIQMYGIVLVRRLLQLQCAGPELDAEPFPELPGFEGVLAEMTFAGATGSGE